MFDNLKMYIDVNDLMAKISEEELYRRFAKDFPKPITRSPFRDDNNPSFGYYQKAGRWYWKDQATDEMGGIFDYIVKRESTVNNFQDALHFVNESLCLGVETISNERARVIHTTFQDRKKKFVQAIRKQYTQDEYRIWNRWCITPSILEFYNTYAASQIWVMEEGKEKELRWTMQDNNPIFFFHFPKSKHLKAYRPLETNRKRKFLGNVDNNTDINGYDQCDIKVRRPALLVLTKAMKECMFYRSFGIDAMAPQGEGHHLNPDFIRHIKKYCGRIISLYDNDKSGAHGAWRLREEYDIPAFFVPRSFDAKNVTDLWEVNPQQTCKVLNYLSTWSIYRNQFRSYRNLLQGGLLSEPPSERQDRY